ncbi:YlaN family protein [Geomicrobium halophilum]|uniref:YlaN family protein n=1 Tax=Geomicrobium halophilum TaxID=549000 RepID=UPI00160A5658|nr:YlaN family protein [Geomicrobium halophilum]
MHVHMETVTDNKEQAYAVLKADAEKIRQLIEVQMDNLTMPQCPLYEEVLDTQMFGLSREIDFAIRLNLIDEQSGKHIMSELERKLAVLHEATVNK